MTHTAPRSTAPRDATAAAPPVPPVGAGGGLDTGVDAAVVRFDTFLFAAAGTVLVTRSLLAATGYPQVGGHTELHVAHVLWGGLLLGAAVTTVAVTLGSQSKFWSAVVGGVGFGLFIDEVGKFLTKDVDYFFKPAVAIIYAVLLTTYVIGRALLQRQRLTPARARALAGIAVADQSLGRLTEVRRLATLQALDRFGSDEDVVALRQCLARPGAGRSGLAVQDAVTRARDGSAAFLAACADHRWVRRVVFTVLAAQAAFSIAEATVVSVAHRVTGFGEGVTEVGWLASAAVGAVLVATGLISARRHWFGGLQLVQAGLLVELLVTDVFKFAVIQFAALGSFALHAVLLAVISATVRDNRRIGVLARQA